LENIYNSYSIFENLIATTKTRNCIVIELSRAIDSNFVVSNKQLDEPKNQHSKWLIGRSSSEVFSLCKKTVYFNQYW
jgi:hypothetical protein